jgi:hypothetical protein
MQLITPCLEINITERLKAANGELGEFYEYAAVASEPFKVNVALTIEIGTHLLDLKISHITEAAGKSALVIALAGKPESFNQAATRQKLSGSADEFGKTKVICENTHYVRTASGPNKRFILVRLYGTLLINIEKLRMKRPLIEGESQFADN